MLKVTLSTKSLDKKHVGYSAPIDQKDVIEYDENYSQKRGDAPNT